MKKKSRFVIGCAVMLLIVNCSGCGDRQNNTTIDTEQVSTLSEAEEDPTITFPYELDDGKVIVNSLFPSTIANPDNGDAYGEDIASLEIINASEEFIETITITITMPDDSMITFAGESIPAGKKAWLFAQNNETIDLQTECTAIQVQKTTGEGELMEQKIAVTVDDQLVKLINLTDEDLTGLQVTCHCLFDELYYGGHAYQYPVELLPASGDVSFEAVECYMGSPEVVSIQ